MLPFEIAPAIKMQELASNFIQLAGDQPRMNTSTFAFLMNKDSYKKLSNAHKKVIDQFSGKNIAKWAGQNWADIEAPGEKVMRSKKKNNFLTIPAGEVAKMKELAKPAIARWIKIMKKKGVDGDQLISDARAMIEKHNK
jgi:TRAP-type C4-dicarboxylate transport system substrate-binding protein